MHEKREEPKESPWTDDEPVRSGDRGLRQRWRARDSGKTAGWRASGHWTQGCSAVAVPARPIWRSSAAGKPCRGFFLVCSAVASRGRGVA